MPRSALSLLLTDEYRRRFHSLRARAVLIAAEAWQLNQDDLDGSHARWVAVAAPALATLQAAGTHLSAGYLAAFVAAETLTGPAARTPTAAAGVDRLGRPLEDALAPSLYTVKAALKDGEAFDAASRHGLNRARRIAGEEAVAPARAELADGIAAHDEISGWRRVTSGGCGACLAASDGVFRDSEPLPVHDGCHCTSEPVVRDVPDVARRPAGRDLFDQLGRARQDEILGPEKAALVRDGQVPLSALVQHQTFTWLPSGITEAPLDLVERRAV
jgi:hypothetical protein